jgi:hypothetical protein
MEATGGSHPVGRHEATRAPQKEVLPGLRRLGSLILSLWVADRECRLADLRP